MTIWEKSILNMQKGVQKLTAVAAVFSERVKVEIAIIRLRVRMDEIKTRIDGLQRAIGQRFVELSSKGLLPKNSEHLLYDDIIATSLAEIADAKKEIEDLKEEIRSELEVLKPSPTDEEEQPA